MTGLNEVQLMEYDNLLEIMYNVIDEQSLKVFHAMKCRDAFLPLLKK